MSEHDEPILKKNTHPKVSNAEEPIVEKITNVLFNQPFGVLCTAGQRHSYGSLLAYYVTEDCKQIIFSTPVSTRKYQLLSENENVAFLVDTRSQVQDRLMAIEAVTATGKCHELKNPANDNVFKELLVSNHTYLKEMLSTKRYALFKISVYRYFYVTRFQEVHEWNPNQTG